MQDSSQQRQRNECILELVDALKMRGLVCSRVRVGEDATDVELVERPPHDEQPSAEEAAKRSEREALGGVAL